MFAVGCLQRRAYKVRSWMDAEDFLTKLAHASGKLMRGGEPDLNTAAKMVLYDWQRGKIPFFRLPPGYLPDAAHSAPATDQAADVPASSVAGPAEDQASLSSALHHTGMMNVVRDFQQHIHWSVGTCGSSSCGR